MSYLITEHVHLSPFLLVEPGGGRFLASGASVNVDILINVSRKVLEMLISRTDRVTVEVLIELAGREPQEWMNVVELGRGR